MTWLLIAAEAEAAGGMSTGVSIAIAIGVPIVIALIPIVLSQLKKNKWIVKLHVEGVLDAGAKRLVKVLEKLQKEKGLSGSEVLKIGVGKLIEKYGASKEDATDALEAAHTVDKRARDILEKATSNANFPEPPEGGS